MPYSVMIWLVDREHHGPSGLETREDRHSSQKTAQNPAQALPSTIAFTIPISPPARPRA